MTDEEVIAALGPRLRGIRLQRRLTLAEVSESTGISISTLSRLESGERRATVELLLPLARVYRATLDDLVGAPPTGDPRVHLRPMRARNQDATVIPLTQRPGGLQAFKHIVPNRGEDPAPIQQSHEGYEWLYVLNGSLKLLLGDDALVLEAGEVVEFDTRTPHWFGPAGTGPVEFLSLFGAQGERAHVRVRRPRR